MRLNFLSILPIVFLMISSMLFAQDNATLETYRSVHPRLFLNAQEAKNIKANIKGTHKELWKSYVKDVDSILLTKPDVYRADPGEQLWQRVVGEKMSKLAFAYLITHDKKYLKAGEEWATASCGYPTWGLYPADMEKSGRPLYNFTGQPETGTKENPGGTSAKFGLSYGHQLLGLAMLYDYAFNDLNPITKALIHKTLFERGASCYAPILSGYNPLQNHSWINSTGLLASGLALFDEEPIVKGWLKLPEDVWNNTNTLLSPDGASHEGFGYWQYGIEYLLKMQALLKLTGKGQTTSAFWDNTANYALYMMLPRNAWTKTNCQVDYNDGKRYPYNGPDYLLRILAKRNKDGVAQWLANELDKKNINNSQSASWLGLIAYDPSIKPTPPTRNQAYPISFYQYGFCFCSQ